jgi:carbon starvation protein
VNAAVLAIIALALFALGYRFYSSFLARTLFSLSDDELVPSREFEDGIDFVPTRRHVLWGHHFASIAGVPSARSPATW